MNMNELDQQRMPMPVNSHGQQQQVSQPPQPPVPDPFAVAQYQNIGVPDVPISYGGGVADSLLNDNEVPDEVKKNFWYLFHKDNVLTFLDEERKASKLLNFDIIKIDILNHPLPSVKPVANVIVPPTLSFIVMVTSFPVIRVPFSQVKYP